MCSVSQARTSAFALIENVARLLTSMSATTIHVEPLREAANDVAVLGLGECLQRFCGYIAEGPN